MNEIFEKIYAASNINTEESKQTELFEQIYKEAEMLNEMNPKLRAMLLGGALAAGLGMQSCSMPTDIPYDPPVIEQPAPTDETPTDETPGEETPETPGETPDNPDNPDNPGTDDTDPTLESVFGLGHADRLTNFTSYEHITNDMGLTYSFIYKDLTTNAGIDNIYSYSNGQLKLLVGAENDSFNGYILMGGDDDNDTRNEYAYLIPDDAVELFEDLGLTFPSSSN